MNPESPRTRHLTLVALQGSLWVMQSCNFTVAMFHASALALSLQFASLMVISVAAGISMSCLQRWSRSVTARAIRVP